MAVTMHLDLPAEAADLYEPLNRELGIRSGHLPEGLIHHFAERAADGFRIFEIWESREAFGTFASSLLLPALDKVTGGRAPSLEPTFGVLEDEFHR
jgi:hypothetical protein